MSSLSLALPSFLIPKERTKIGKFILSRLKSAYISMSRSDQLFDRSM